MWWGGEVGGLEYVGRHLVVASNENVLPMIAFDISCSPVVICRHQRLQRRMPKGAITTTIKHAIKHAIKLKT